MLKEFRYEAVDADGQPIHGILEADDENALRSLLAGRGQKMLSAVSVEIAQPDQDLTRLPYRLSRLRITESLRTAFLTRLPVNVALQATAREPGWNPASAMLPWFQAATAMLLALTGLQAAVSGGAGFALYVAVILTVLVFGPGWLLIRKLERRPGRLLRQLATRLEVEGANFTKMAHLLPGNLGEIMHSELPDDQKLLVTSELMSEASGSDFARHRLFLSLMGPVFLLMMALGLCYGFLFLVVPGFREIFDGFELALPGLTMLLIMISGSVEYLGLPGAIGLTLFGMLLITGLFFVTYRGWLNNPLQSVPLLGASLRWINLADVARWLAALLRNNVAPDESLRVAVRQSHSDAVREDGPQLAAMIGDGRMLSTATTSLSGLPLSLLAGLAKDPEDSRRRYAVVSTLDSLARMFDRAAFSSGRLMATFLQVLMLTVVSGIVGVTVVALFLPLVQLLNNLS